MKTTFEQLVGKGTRTALFSAAAIGFAKVLSLCLRVAQKKEDVRKNYFKILGGTSALLVTGGAIVVIAKKRADADKYERERRADGELYTVQKMADAQLIKFKVKAGVKVVITDDGNDDDDNLDDDQGKTDISFIEYFKLRFNMPSLPPFLKSIMRGVPPGYDEAMLLHILSMLGAFCFSKVRAVYSDKAIHAPNLQVIVEGNWGAGKGKFEQIFKTLFARTIELSKKKIEFMNEKDYDGVIIQTTGIGTSMSRYVDILACNQGCHSYLFNSEVRALGNDLKKNNGINFDFIRKAFENGDICRNNRSKDGKNGIFPIFMNYTITGTPNDIDYSFKKELEGGTLSRICWTIIPEAGRECAVLRLPEGEELEKVRDQIDEWTANFAYHSEPGSGDIAAEEYHIKLDYVCKALDDWNAQQYDLSVKENNPARKDVRMRMATIAFHCAMILHMLYGEPKDTYSKQHVVDLTLFIADYCIERFLHKFGKAQNIQRKANEDAEKVDTEKVRGNSEPSDSSEASGLVTDISMLAELHSKVDDKGNHLYGWDKLSKISGIPTSTLRDKVRKFNSRKKK